MKQRTTNQYIDGLINAILSNDDEAIRVAQYGGRGGGGGNYAPGGGPSAGGGGTSGGLGQAFNDFGSDANMESRLESVHKPAPLDPDRNIEKRLEKDHKFAEEDSINYELSFGERMKLKKRQMIHRREKALSDAAKRVDQNTPSFIREHYKDKPHAVTPFEVTLESRRLHPDFSDLEKLPPQIKPTRRHTVAAWEDEQSDIFSGTSSQHTNGDDNPEVDGTSTVFDGGVQDKKEKDFSGQRRNQDPGGGFKHVDYANQTQEEVMQQLQDDAKNDEAWMTREFGGAFREPGLDEQIAGPSRAVSPTAGVPSLVEFLRSQLGTIQNGNQGLQQQLDYARQDDGGKRKINAPRRPQDMHAYLPNGDYVRKNRMEEYGDNAEPIVQWDGLFDDPDYTGGDTMGTFWKGPTV